MLLKPGTGNRSLNLVPRAFSSFKMAVGETPGQGCQSGSKSSLEFRHTNTIKCLRFVWIMVSDCRKQTGPPDAGNNLRKSHFIMRHVTKYSTIHGVFQQPWPGVSPIAILNEEKALGTRLQESGNKRWAVFPIKNSKWWTRKLSGGKKINANRKIYRKSQIIRFKRSLES